LVLAERSARHLVSRATRSNNHASLLADFSCPDGNHCGWSDHPGPTTERASSFSRVRHASGRNAQFEPLAYAPFTSSGERIELPPQMRGVQGVLLTQLVEDRKLKIEIFPGKTAVDVTEFTTGAKTYER
jgi:hypothetical protein